MRDLESANSLGFAEFDRRQLERVARKKDSREAAAESRRRAEAEKAEKDSPLDLGTPSFGGGTHQLLIRCSRWVDFFF